MGCGPGPQLGAYKGQPIDGVSYTSMSLSLSFSLSLKMNKIFKYILKKDFVIQGYYLCLTLYIEYVNI